MSSSVTAQGAVTNNRKVSTLREWHIAPNMWLLCQVEYIVHPSVGRTDVNLVLSHGIHRIGVSTSV
jgi:hypothetical protein